MALASSKEIKGKRPPACPITVSCSPVFPNVRRGISPALGFGGFALAAVAARPANTPPINVLRFIGPTSFRLWMDPDSVEHAGVRRYTENGWPPCGEYRISTRSSDLAAAGGGTVPLIRISLGLTSRP